MGDVTPDRDTTVLGPEVFASTDEAVICWRGENYVKQAEVERLREALAGVLDRQNDYPTDLSRDPAWNEAFNRGWEALDG